MGSGELCAGLGRSKIVAMVQFAGSYTHVKAENVDAYMAAIGVPWIARKAAAAVTPALEITQDGEDWTMSWKTSVISNTVKFKLGVEFEEKNPGGKVVKATLEGNKLTLVHASERAGDIRRELEFSDTGIIMTMTAVTQNVSAKRHFKRS